MKLLTGWLYRAYKILLGLRYDQVVVIARCALASGLLITILFTDIDQLFPKSAFNVGVYHNSVVPNLFTILGFENLWLSKAITIAVLVWVIIGLLPQISCFFHAWVAYSFHLQATIVEGGDQLAQIITILLIPILLIDKRLFHWHDYDWLKVEYPQFIYDFSISSMYMIKLQMAVLYFFAFVDKLKTPFWTDGSAVYYWLNHNLFGIENAVSPLFSLIVNNTFLSPIATWAVILVEVILFAGIFMSKERRILLFFLGIMFHFTIVIVHGLFSFFLAMLAGLLIYLIPWDYNYYLASKKKTSMPKSFLIRSIIILFLISLTSCDDKDFDNMGSEQDTPRLEKYYDIISSLYYWQSFIPEYKDLKLESNATPMELMNVISTFSPNMVDRWSFAIPLEEWDKISGGFAGDFGIGLRFHTDNDLRIAYILPNSSSDILGLERGVQVLQINETEAKYENLERLSQHLSGPNTLRLQYVNTNTDTVHTEINRIEYTSDPILYSEVFFSSNLKIGYINVFSFNQNLEQALKLVLDSFEKANVDKLIVDIRYNRGGFLNVMKYLADKLICDQNGPIPFYKTIHNDEYQDFNTTTYLSGSVSNLCISEIVFITTSATTSASEVLINAMRPIIRTHVVGTKTQGKLMGSHVVRLDDYALSPISYKIINNLNEHDNHKGLSPDKLVEDDVQHNWGVNEECIANSIALLIGNETSVNERHNRIHNSSQYELIDSPDFLDGSFDIWGNEWRK